MFKKGLNYFLTRASKKALQALSVEPFHVIKKGYPIRWYILKRSQNAVNLSEKLHLNKKYCEKVRSVKNKTQ